ncbi:MFS transporter [Geobacillus sp. B4113_201601]|uniref:MFS transporter n=1 Tax=Geobacillus sp. B4113_201601 TaxID=1586290 RepID=UPI00053B0AAE|nr:MFS transporter [Geobacillus sp. B4113_201601]
MHRGPWYKDRVLFLTASFFFWLSLFIYMPILSPYIEEIGGTYSFIGLVLGSYGLMQLLCRLPIGIVSDLAQRRKTFVILGMVFAMGSGFLFALTDSLGWALTSRALAGIAAATWVAFTVLYSCYFHSKETHRAMSQISLIVVLAQLTGMTVSGYMVDQWGWHAPFWAGGVLGATGAFLSIWVSEPKRDDERRQTIQLKHLLLVIKEPQLWKVSTLSVLAHGIIFTTMFGFTPAYALKIGLKEGDLSMLTFCFMIPHALATFFIGKTLVPRWGKWGSLLMAFSGTALFTFMIPAVSGSISFYVVQAGNGFFLGLLFPLLLGMAIESVDEAKKATAMGTYQAIYAIGMFGGPYLAGILNESIRIQFAFYFSGTLGLVAIGLIVAWKHGEWIPLLNKIIHKEYQ